MSGLFDCGKNSAETSRFDDLQLKISRKESIQASGTQQEFS